MYFFSTELFRSAFAPSLQEIKSHTLDMESKKKTPYILYDTYDATQLVYP